MYKAKDDENENDNKTMFRQWFTWIVRCSIMDTWMDTWIGTLADCIVFSSFKWQCWISQVSTRLKALTRN